MKAQVHISLRHMLCFLNISLCTLNKCCFCFLVAVDLVTYLTRFQWDLAKYPIKQSLKNISEIISKVRQPVIFCVPNSTNGCLATVKTVLSCIIQLWTSFAVFLIHFSNFLRVNCGVLRAKNMYTFQILFNTICLLYCQSAVES